MSREEFKVGGNVRPVEKMRSWYKEKYGFVKGKIVEMSGLGISAKVRYKGNKTRWILLDHLEVM